jgi:hypothetical protein
MPARVAIRERRSEVLEIGGIVRRTVRRLTTVRPLGRAPDRDEELQPSLLRAAGEVVDVVEPVRGIEWICGVRRTSRGGVHPHDDRPQNGDVRIASAIEHR